MADRLERAALNRLIETNRDGERGFRLAAAHIENAALKRLFTELAEQRATFATELLPHAQRLGGADAGDGTAVGALHRAWIALEGRFLPDTAVTRSVERGDEATMRIYLDALNGMLPPQSRELIERQFEELEEAHLRIPVREGFPA